MKIYKCDGQKAGVMHSTNLDTVGTADAYAVQDSLVCSGCNCGSWEQSTLVHCHDRPDAFDCPYCLRHYEFIGIIMYKGGIDDCALVSRLSTITTGKRRVL